MLEAVRGVPLTLLSNALLPVVAPVGAAGILSAAPGLYLPDQFGVRLPPGCTRWELELDQTGLPGRVPIWLHVEFHIQGAWQHDAGSDHVMPHGGYLSSSTKQRTTVNRLSSRIGSVKASMVAPSPYPHAYLPTPYPDAYRIAVHRCDGWTVTLKMTVL